MPPKRSRKRKQTPHRLAEELRKKKAAKRFPADDPTSSSASLDDSLQLPGPSGMSTVSQATDEEDAYRGQFTSDDTHACNEDWLQTIGKEDAQMMAMMMYDNYIIRFGLLQTKAAEEVALLLGTNEKTMRRWRSDWIANSGSFSQSSRGKYERYVVVDEEEYRDMALKWIRENASCKGKPNLTAKILSSWVNAKLLPHVRQHHPSVRQEISAVTATRWLHKLGFNPTSTKMGVYIDGHERQDVVEYRKLFLRKLEILESTHAPAPRVSDEPDSSLTSALKRLILLYHDESTFHSNDDRGWVWSQQIKPKGQGRGIMVSDFIDEHNGYLALSDTEYEEAHSSHPNLWKEARFLLKYGTDSQGYWNSEKFMRQVEQAATIAKIKYPPATHSLVFLFDQSSKYTAYDSDALQASRMNVNPGGSQPVMRDTAFNGSSEDGGQKRCPERNASSAD